MIRSILADKTLPLPDPGAKPGRIRPAAGGAGRTLTIACYLLTVMSTSFLRISGTKIVDEDGKEVVLRGAGLGGWLT